MSLIKSIVMLLVGAAVFFIGMNKMSTGLKNLTGRGLKRMLKKISNNRVAGFSIGIGVTAIVQSSATTGIMTIGFMNAGAMTIFQALSINLGAYVGTTVTGLIASLSSFPFSDYFVLLAALGVILSFFSNEKVKNIGELCAGFGLLFFGLETMKSSLNVETGSIELINAVQNFFLLIDFPLILVLVGAIVTMLLQSSSATTGILVAMIGTGSISLTSACFIVLGATVGTVFTTMLATIGGSINSKRTGVVCLIIRSIAALVGLAIYWPLANVINDLLLSVFKQPGLALAMFMAIFSAVSMIAFLPFVGFFEKLAVRLMKDRHEEKKRKAIRFIDSHLINTPPIAMMQVKREIINMMQLSFDNIKRGYARIMSQNNREDKEIIETEGKIDYINSEIVSFLINLSPRVSVSNEQILGSYFHVINDIERIGDHAYNLYEASLKMANNDLSFSQAAKEQVDVMFDTIEKMFLLTFEIFENNKKEDLKKLHDLENKTDELKNSLSSHHFERVQNNMCSIENSSYFTSLVSELERVADHLVNIGYSIVNPIGDTEEDENKKAPLFHKKNKYE